MHMTPGRNQSCAIFLLCIVLLSILPIACGPEDYQNSIQQFQDASSVVINATEAFLNNMNTLEQNKQLDQTVFEKKSLDLPALNKVEIISPEEIRLRTDALNALAQYTSNLAQLAQGNAGSAVTESTSQLSTSLQNLAQDAKKLPGPQSSFLNNPKFSGILSSAAGAVGAVAQLIVEHKARREIEKSIVDNDAAVTALIQQISDDAQGAYLRQKNQLSEYGVQLSRDYDLEIRRDPDPVLLLILAKNIKTYRAKESQIPAADPSPAIAKMKDAHQALVSYVKSNKSPKTLSELIATVQDLANAARPLGQAIQNLTSASL